MDNVQNNIQYKFKSERVPTGEDTYYEKQVIKNGKAVFIVEDIETKHEFYEGKVDYNEDEKIMADAMVQAYCEWYADNRNDLIQFYSK